MLSLEFLAVKPCKHDAYEAIPKKRVDLDLDECERMLSEKGYEIVSNPKVMLVVRKEVEISLYPRGRLLINSVSDKDVAEVIARELFEALGM